MSLVEYARGNAAASSVPFADEITLGLNVVEQRTFTRAQLDNPTVWQSDLDHFDGYVGPFSALTTLARSDFIRTTTGPMPIASGHCSNGQML
jgi:hypothetical protein